ncbi:unnamed protein product, partial [Discosporangium mesarthrocarpum]
MEMVRNIVERERKNVERGLGGREKKAEWETHVKTLQYLEETRKPVRFGTWTAHDVETLNKIQLLTAKEVVYLVNLSKRDYLRKANKWLPKLQARIDELGGGNMIPFSVEFEQEV